MSGFRIDIANFLTSVERVDNRIKTATKLYAESAKEELVADAKTNAPWTDRTGLSRQTIDGYIQSSDKATVINIRGNTPQFKYLEFCHEKRYAILVPTIKRNMQRIKSAWIRNVMK